MNIVDRIEVELVGRSTLPMKPTELYLGRSQMFSLRAFINKHRRYLTQVGDLTYDNDTQRDVLYGLGLIEVRRDSYFKMY